MSTSKEYLQFILDQLSQLDQITCQQMMGEYILYYQGRIAAYLCDNRLLVKPVEAARTMLPQAPLEPPYPGAKEMLLVEDPEDRQGLIALFQAMLPQLPPPKPKKPKTPKQPKISKLKDTERSNL